MKLGFRDLRLFEGDWDGLFAFGAEVGATTLQIDLPPEEDWDRIKALIAQTHIHLSSITAMSTRLLGPDPEAARQDGAKVIQAIAAARTLGAPCVSQFAGHDPARSADENIEAFREVFSPLAEQAETAGVALVFENCPLVSGRPPVVQNLAYCPAAWDAMFEAVPSSAIALELDTAHLPWLGIDVLRCIGDYAARIRHVHVKDCIIDAEGQQRYGRLDNRFYRYGVPGDGGIDFTAVVDALAASGYDGSLTLDLRPTTRETITRGMAHMQNILQRTPTPQRKAGSMNATVIRNCDIPVDHAPWGSLQWLVNKDTAPDAAMTVGRVTFKPGEGNPAHAHPNCDEVLFVVQGTLEHRLPQGGTARLEPGDCIVLPRGGAHTAKNVGEGEAVVLVAFNAGDRMTQSATADIA